MLGALAPHASLATFLSSNGLENGIPETLGLQVPTVVDQNTGSTFKHDMQQWCDT